jgi:RimJ/RimL family protein N-acetyltransferase
MLSGKIVGLRAIEKSDLPILQNWRNRPELRQYFREYKELNSDKQNAWYERFVLNDPNTNMFSIIELKTALLLGVCGLCYINWVCRNADFSIYIGANDLYIDDKFAIDAAKTMMKYGFEELCLHRLWAEVYDFDEKKIYFFKKLGFKIDGRFRQSYWHDGKWHDSLFFSLLEDEYVNKYKSEERDE